MNCRRPNCPRMAGAKRRGLCGRCWRSPIFRKAYALPSQCGLAKRITDAESAHMTDAELDAMIAANRESMPGGLNLDGPPARIGKAGLFKRS